MVRSDSRDFATFREYFARDRGCTIIDCAPEHLISPCDGWLSAFPVEAGGCFSIKGTRYRLQDLVDDGPLAAKYEGGICLILRLGPSDYHHYCCIDDGYLWQNHALPGALRVARPLVPGPHPVYMRHRRSWCLMVTEHFGPVIQVEIGALALGLIANNQENTRVRRGDEKGHFDLAGSAIALLFEPGRVRLLSDLCAELEACGEARVRQGMWIGYQTNKEALCTH